MYGHLRGLSDSALRLYLFLYEQAKDNPSFRMTLPVLAEQARIPLSDVVPAQAELEAAELVEKEKSRLVRVGDISCSLRFTKDVDKERDSLLRENEQLRERVKELESGDASGLSDHLSPVQASVVRAAEDVVGRALSYEETWYLGGLVAQYKSPRVRDLIYAQREAKNPLRATYAILRNGAKGKPFQKKTEEPEYFKPPKGYDPWAKEGGTE